MNAKVMRRTGLLSAVVMKSAMVPVRARYVFLKKPAFAIFLSIFFCFRFCQYMRKTQQMAKTGVLTLPLSICGVLP